MNKITLGKTGLVIEKNGLGCLPIQRISEQDAVYLLYKAYDGGINFYDTARAYSDSEQKVGAAFSGMRDKVVLATKTAAQTADTMWKDLETSLRTLKTDYIDIYQFHNPSFCPRPGGEDGLYDAALEAKKQGKIRHISLSNHRLLVAHEAIDSGLYATLQFPFSYLAGAQELELVQKCRENHMGFIAMKGMAGGLIRDGLTASAWMQKMPGCCSISRQMASILARSCETFMDFTGAWSARAHPRTTPLCTSTMPTFSVKPGRFLRSARIFVVSIVFLLWSGSARGNVPGEL